MKKEVWLAAFSGVLVTFLGDLFGSQKSNSISELFGKRIMELLHISSGIPIIYALVALLILVSIVLFVEEPKDKKEGFVRGLAVLSIINLTGLKSEDTKPTIQATLQKSSVQVASLFSFPMENTGANTVLYQNFRPGWATIQVPPDWVSSTRPEVSFLNGLLNTVSTTPRNLVFLPGTRVWVADFFDTENRGYRYAKVKVRVSDGHEEEVWIPAGKKDWNNTLSFDTH